MDMYGNYVGLSAAPSALRGGGSCWPLENDDVVYTTEGAAPGIGSSYAVGGGFVVRDGAAPTPSDVSAFAEAALAASYCSIPSGDTERGGREESHNPQQPQRHSVYSFPSVPSITNWSGGDGGFYDGPQHNKGPWQAVNNHGGVEDNRHERARQAVGVDGGGSAGARDPGDGISTKRQARINALEQELLELTQPQKRMRSAAAAAAAPWLPLTNGMTFPPARRDLTHLLQDSRRDEEAMKSIISASSPGALARVPVNDTTTNHPATNAVRRRRRGASPGEAEPLFPTTSPEQQHHHNPDRSEPFGRNQELSSRRHGRVTAVGPTIPKIKKRKVADRCQHPGCSRGSTFGPKGAARKTIYCATHKREGMVTISSRQCAGDMCSTAPSYGFQGKRASFCSKHKMPGMINVVTPRCQRDGCASCASYGHAEERRPLFCARHAPDGMINVVSRKCLHAGCIKNPSYGHPGDRRASFCVDHHQTGMSNVVSPKCPAAGCGKAPSFGKNGDRKATWCKAHKQQGMVNILYKRQLKKAG